MHRYLVERTFPPGALDGLDAATKKKVNANNATVCVRWIQSYASADKTKTFCVYEGPSEAAVRKAAGSQCAARRQCYGGTRNVVTEVSAETSVASH